MPRIVDVAITGDALLVDVDDGRTISVPIGFYPRLANATPAEREGFEISNGGFGIHWPELDEDVGVEGLLLGRPSTESPASLQRWLSTRAQRT